MCTGFGWSAHFIPKSIDLEALRGISHNFILNRSSDGAFRKRKSSGVIVIADWRFFFPPYQFVVFIAQKVIRWVATIIHYCDFWYNDAADDERSYIKIPC